MLLFDAWHDTLILLLVLLLPKPRAHSWPAWPQWPRRSERCGVLSHIYHNFNNLLSQVLCVVTLSPGHRACFWCWFRTQRKGALAILVIPLGSSFHYQQQQNTGLVTWADWPLVRCEMRGVCHPRCQEAECLHFCLWLETGERTGEAGPCLMTDSQRRAKSGLTRDTRLRNLWSACRALTALTVCQVITSHFAVILLIVWYLKKTSRPTSGSRSKKLNSSCKLNKTWT